MKKGTLKTIAVVLAFLLLGTAVAACMTKGFSDWNPYGWFDSKEDCEHEYGEDGKCTKCGEEKPVESAGGLYISGSNLDAGGIALHMAKNPRVLSASTSTLVEADSYTITATLSPSGSIGQLNWSLSGNDDGGVLMTVASNTLSAVIKLNNSSGFTTQKTLTVTLKNNTSVTANCTIDYYKRIKYTFTSNDSVLDFTDNDTDTLSCRAGADFGNGTVTPDIETTGGTFIWDDLIVKDFGTLTVGSTVVTLNNNITFTGSDFTVKMSASSVPTFMKVVSGSYNEDVFSAFCIKLGEVLDEYGDSDVYNNFIIKVNYVVKVAGKTIDTGVTVGGTGSNQCLSIYFPYATSFSSTMSDITF